MIWYFSTLHLHLTQLTINYLGRVLISWAGGGGVAARFGQLGGGDTLICPKFKANDINFLGKNSVNKTIVLLSKKFFEIVMHFKCRLSETHQSEGQSQQNPIIAKQQCFFQSTHPEVQAALQGCEQSNPHTTLCSF